jgi:hypothetical protein
MDAWLHIGMPKTGTTSVQETLAFGMRDPAFEYCGFGLVNGSAPLGELLGLERHLVEQRRLRLGIGNRDPRRHLQRRLERSIRRAQSRGATLVLSAETGYGWSRESHQKLFQILAPFGLQLKALVYVRPPLDWLASSIGEGIKFGVLANQQAIERVFEPSALQRRMAIAERLEMLAATYGAQRLVVRPFLRDALHQGCVVQDLAQQLGIQITSQQVRRRNDSLPLNGSRALHIRNQTQGRTLRGPLDLMRRDALISRLSRVFQGESSLRLAPTLLGGCEPFVQDQVQRLRRCFGLELPLSVGAGRAADEPPLANLQGLLELPEAARLKLAGACGVPGNPPIALLLEQLEQRWDGGFVGQQLQRRLRRHWHHAWRAV